MSSAKYVPPSMRNRGNNREAPSWFREEDARKKKEEERKKNGMVNTEENFPSLSASPSKSNNQWKSSFAALATEWNEHDEEEKVNRQIREDKDRREHQRRLAEERNVVTLRRRDNYFEEDYNVGPSTYMTDHTEANDDEWTVIQHKKPKAELTLEEQIERDRKREEEERKIQEDSVWDNSNGDEWDYRDRRAVA